MATSSSQSVQLSGPLFSLPPVPETTSDFTSDEESFVVLGNSFDCEINPSLINTPVAENGIIDRIEQSVDNVLAELADSSSELPLPALENHFQAKKNLDSVTTIPSNLPSDEIQQKVSSLVEENQHLKNIILQNNMSMKSQYQRIVAWRDDVEKTYQVHKEKFEEAKAYINSLKTEINDLNKVTETQAKQISDLKNAELNNCTEKLEKLDLSARALDLEKLLSETRDENQKLKVIIAQSQTDAREENAVWLASEIKKSRCENIRRSTCMGSLDENKITDYDMTQEELKKIRHQLMIAQQKITEMECDKTMHANLIATKDKQISNLQNLLEQFKYTEDDMFAMKEQLELYKADFEMEQKAKESIRSEKEQMAEDILKLQDRNRKLQEEVEVYRNQSGYVYIPETRSSSTSQARQTNELMCPKCSFKFKTYQALENHVHRCLELN